MLGSTSPRRRSRSIFSVARMGGSDAPWPGSAGLAAASPLPEPKATLAAPMLCMNCRLVHVRAACLFRKSKGMPPHRKNIRNPHYRGLQIIVTLFAVAALPLHFVQGRLSAPKDAGGDTGATEEVVTIICNPQ